MSRYSFDPGLSISAIVLIVLAVLCILTALSAFVGWIFMLLWNYAVAPTFDLPELTFYVAWALSFLLCLLTSNFKATFSSNKSC